MSIHPHIWFLLSRAVRHASVYRPNVMRITQCYDWLTITVSAKETP